MTFLLALVLISIGWLVRLTNRLAETQRELRELQSALEMMQLRVSPPGPARGAATTAAPPAEAPGWESVPPGDEPPSHTTAPFAPLADPGPEAATAADEPPPRTAWPGAGLERPPRVAESLESLIGGRWLLYIGMATLLIGASYFVKLAIDNEWITPAMRIAVGSLVGLLLVVAGPQFRQRGYALYGQILAGGGLAILYLCVYAAFNYYALIGSTPAFVLMVLVTAGAAAMADREQSQGLALMAVGGGFCTPFLVSSGRDAQLALFGYDAMLVAGTMLLARRRNWPALNALSFGLTLFTLTAWAGTYYRPDRWIPTYWFLTLFVAMFIYIRHESARWGTPAARLVSHLLVLAPVLYHLVALAILSDHGTVFLVYLVLATAAGLWVNARPEAAALRLVLWFAVMLPLFAWTMEYRAWPAAATCAVATAVYALHFAAQAVVVQRDARFGGADVALLYVSAVGLYLGFEAALESRWIAVLPLVALVIGGWNAVVALAARRRFPSVWVHFAVLTATFGAVAVARQFDGPAKPVGWAVVASGLLWLGIVESGRWLRVSGAVLISIAIAQLLRLLFAPVPVSQAVLFNPRTLAALFVVGLLFAVSRVYRRPPSPGTPSREIRATLIVVANLLALALITAEIRSFWSVQSPGRSGYLALHMMTSLAWAIYAVALIVFGMRRRYAPVRYLAMAVLAVTILKVFLLDLSELEQAYRVLSAIGLGVLLLIASFLYQRYREELSADERA
jgi:uncharacterized membrane protein